MAEPTPTAGDAPIVDLPRSGALQPEETSPDGPCESCGSPQARPWSTPEGPARLCPPCATLNGIGCP
jgi:hypothetical protein